MPTEKVPGNVRDLVRRLWDREYEDLCDDSRVLWEIVAFAKGHSIPRVERRDDGPSEVENKAAAHIGFKVAEIIARERL